MYSTIILFFISINRNINIQKEVLIKAENELGYITSLNEKIKINNSHLKELKTRNETRDKLKEEETNLIKRRNILKASINRYNKLNEDLRNKISYYE
mgnify:CR=1 FL=1